MQPQSGAFQDCSETVIFDLNESVFGRIRQFSSPISRCSDGRRQYSTTRTIPPPRNNYRAIGRSNDWTRKDSMDLKNERDYSSYVFGLVNAFYYNRSETQIYAQIFRGPRFEKHRALEGALKNFVISKAKSPSVIRVRLLEAIH